MDYLLLIVEECEYIRVTLEVRTGICGWVDVTGSNLGAVSYEVIFSSAKPILLDSAFWCRAWDSENHISPFQLDPRLVRQLGGIKGSLESRRKDKGHPYSGLLLLIASPSSGPPPWQWQFVPVSSCFSTYPEQISLWPFRGYQHWVKLPPQRSESQLYWALLQAPEVPAITRQRPSSEVWVQLYWGLI